MVELVEAILAALLPPAHRHTSHGDGPAAEAHQFRAQGLPSQLAAATRIALPDA